MTLSSFTWLFTGICLNAIAQLLLKAGTNAIGAIYLNGQARHWLALVLQLIQQWPILGGFLCYGVSVIVWIIGLSRVDVSLAYPLLSLGYILNIFGAWIFLGEVLSLQRIIAVIIILVGVMLLVQR